jgi:hypothetical protein
MTTETPDEFELILSEAIRRTEVLRYRFLCSAENPHSAPNSRNLMRQIVHAPEALSDLPPIRVDYGNSPRAGGCTGCPGV